MGVFIVSFRRFSPFTCSRLHTHTPTSRSVRTNSPSFCCSSAKLQPCRSRCFPSLQLFSNVLQAILHTAMFMLQLTLCRVKPQLSERADLAPKMRLISEYPTWLTDKMLNWGKGFRKSDKEFTNPDIFGITIGSISELVNEPTVFKCSILVPFHSLLHHVRAQLHIFGHLTGTDPVFLLKITLNNISHTLLMVSLYPLEGTLGCEWCCMNKLDFLA